MRGRQLFLGSMATLLLSLSFPASSSSFTMGNKRARANLRSLLLSSSSEDDWNLGDEDDSRLNEMRDMLESSWNGEAMGQGMVVCSVRLQE